MFLIALFLIILGIVLLKRRREGGRPFRARFKPELREEPKEADLNIRKPLVKIKQPAVKEAEHKLKGEELHKLVKHMKKELE